MNAAIYARASVSGHGDGLEQQAGTCREYADQQRVNIVALVQEVAAGLHPTPLLNALVDMMADGNLDTIICEDPTRITRDTQALEAIQARITKTGGRLLFAKSGSTGPRL